MTILKRSVQNSIRGKRAVAQGLALRHSGPDGAVLSRLSDCAVNVHKNCRTLLGECNSHKNKVMSMVPINIQC